MLAATFIKLSPARDQAIANNCSANVVADLHTLNENYEHGLWTYFVPTAPMHFINPILQSFAKIAPFLNVQEFVEKSMMSQPIDVAVTSWFDRNCFQVISWSLMNPD